MEPEESDHGLSWQIKYGEPPGPVKFITNRYYEGVIEPSAYNYTIHTPVIIIPINRTSALILSEFNDDGEVGLRIHDLRLVEDEMVGSISFNLRGNQLQLRKFKHEMLRVSDSAKCVGIGYFLRKLYYSGFNTIMCPKVLKSKTNSTLRAGMMIVQTAIENNKEDELCPKMD